MANVVHNRDYLGQALSRLPQQFKNKPRIAALLQAWMAEIQAVEDALWDLYFFRILSNNPVGDLIDQIGSIVGQARGGATDALYTLYVSARILANKSDGKRETLIALTRYLVPTTQKVGFREYLKTVFIEVYPVQADPLVVWRDFLNVAKPEGTKLDFVYSAQDYTALFINDSVHGGVNTTSTQRQSSAYGGGGTGLQAGVFGGS